MIIAFLSFVNLSNALLIFLCGIVLLFLLKSIRISDKLWVASFVSVLLIVLISITQTVSYNSLYEQMREKEAMLDTLRIDYAKMKSETVAARVVYADAKTDVTMSRREFENLQKQVNAEFERTVSEIRSVYSQITDEDLDRRANNAIRRARLNLRTNIFH